MTRALALALFVALGCAQPSGEGPSGDGHGPGSGQGAGAGAGHTGGQGAGGQIAIDPSDEPCDPHCSFDGTEVIDCHGNVAKACDPHDLCASGECMPACDAARIGKASVGCEYFAVAMDGLLTADDGCFVAFLANTSPLPAHIGVSYGGTAIDVAAHAAIPKGSGQSVTYDPYSPAEELPPGKVAIVLLASGPGAGLACPGPSAVPDGSAQFLGTGRGLAFKLTTDMPVVAYQMLPYGGGSAMVTGATLLLPTSVWDDNYVAVNAYGWSTLAQSPPSMNLVAVEDATQVTLLPKVAIEGGDGVAAAPANTPVTYLLNAGENLQLSQQAELTGSPVVSDKPIGLWAGHRCMTVPLDTMACDHAEQQIPPIRALGSRYAAVSHRQRSSIAEAPRWRIIGVTNATQLTYDPDVGGPTAVQLGEVVEFSTSSPFVVASQDEHHPFLLATYMTGAEAAGDGYGDPDFVRIVPSEQYLGRYVFFTDPSYPETNLVVVRRKQGGAFADVTLDCAGTLDGWTPIGSGGEHEYLRVDLVRHDFEPQGGCDNGRREMVSTQPFGLWVWGWGTPETSWATSFVSYGYPAGERVAPINGVTVPATPK